MLEPPCHLQDSTLKWCARNLNLLKFLNTCFSQDHPCGSLSTWPRGGLKCPGLGLTCVGQPFGHLAFLGWCGSLVLGSLRACGVQSSR